MAIQFSRQRASNRRVLAFRAAVGRSSKSPQSSATGGM